MIPSFISPGESSEMGKYNFSALRIRKTALAQKSSGKTQKSPTWMDIMSEVPPAAALIRNQAPWYSADQQVRLSFKHTHDMLITLVWRRNGSIYFSQPR